MCAAVTAPDGPIFTRILEFFTRETFRSRGLTPAIFLIRVALHATPGKKPIRRNHCCPRGAFLTRVSENDLPLKGPPPRDKRPYSRRPRAKPRDCQLCWTRTGRQNRMCLSACCRLEIDTTHIGIPALDPQWKPKGCMPLLMGILSFHRGNRSLSVAGAHPGDLVGENGYHAHRSLPSAASGRSQSQTLHLLEKPAKGSTPAEVSDLSEVSRSSSDSSTAKTLWRKRRNL